jgi:hypothetical protein
MKRYAKAVLGGCLAVGAAFGWMVTIVVALGFASDRIWGVSLPKSLEIIVIPIPVFLIFSVGFYVAFRAAYSRNSN